MMLTDIAYRVRQRALQAAHFNQRGRDAWVDARAAGVGPGTLVVDVGAGTGRYRRMFTHCRYVAVDFAQYRGTAVGALREAFAYTQLDCVADVAALPFRGGMVDVVLCTEVLEHVPDPVAALGELLRVLHRGGQLFVTAPLGSALHQVPYHYYGGFTPYFYRLFAQRAGGRVISIDANGGFYLHLAQEVYRLGSFLLERRAWPRWHPARRAVWYVLMVLVPAWLGWLEGRMPRLEEFTIGYHVEIVRE